MTNYHEEIHEWRQTLKTNLRKENSWLALAGLFWLNEGVNSFGAGDENDIIFPDAGIPRQIGAFIVDGENVKLEVSADTLVDVDGVPAKEASLRPDVSGSPTRLKLGALSFILIQREDGFGIRLWDANNPKRESFPGRQWYPIDEDFRIEGRYLSINAPQDGLAIIDFNRAYNPPCAFTHYATCPLPPSQNHLPIPIRAGEKNNCPNDNKEFL